MNSSTPAPTQVIRIQGIFSGVFSGNDTVYMHNLYMTVLFIDKWHFVHHLCCDTDIYADYGYEFWMNGYESNWSTAVATEQELWYTVQSVKKMTVYSINGYAVI